MSAGTTPSKLETSVNYSFYFLPESEHTQQSLVISLVLSGALSVQRDHLHNSVTVNVETIEVKWFFQILFINNHVLIQGSCQHIVSESYSACSASHTIVGIVPGTSMWQLKSRKRKKKYSWERQLCHWIESNIHSMSTFVDNAKKSFLQSQSWMKDI